MTAGMAHHLVSRAVQVTTQHHYRGNDGEEPVHEFQLWATVLIVSTIMLYLAMISMVSFLAISSKANSWQR